MILQLYLPLLKKINMFEYIIQKKAHAKTIFLPRIIFKPHCC
jgi:hypothetical protein